MIIEPSDQDIQNIYERIKGYIYDLKPDFQRDVVWNQEKQQKLIDSIMRGWHIPPIHLVKIEGKDYYEVLDGKQRLYSIYNFITDEFPFTAKFLPGINDFSNLDKKKFSEFPRDLKRDFLFKTIRIFLVTDVRKSEATELFLRLNQGVAVSASEKRNCIYGPVKEHLREVITQYAILFSPETLGFSNLRMAYQDILDKIFFLEQKGNLNYKPNARALEAMYFNQNIDDSLKEHLNKNLEITQNAIQYFYQNYGFKLTKSIIISYYWFLREISSAEKYNLSSASNFLIEFEKWRGIQKFNYENNSSVNKKFIEFGTYLSKGWLDPSSIKGRHRILMDFYSEFINNGTIGEFDDQS